MSIIAGYITPHPPLIIPDIGKGEENKIKTTIQSFHEIARTIAKQKPETIVVITPHHLNYQDYFHMSSGQYGQGNFSHFNSQISVQVQYDQELIEHLSNISDFPCGTRGQQHNDLDHGTMIPLYFVNQYYQDYQVVRLSLSGLSLDKHYHYGKKIGKILNQIDKDIVVIASGDLSHKLKREGPYGYIHEGPEFDKEVIRILKQGHLESLTKINEKLYQKAAECGLRSFVILAGILSQSHIESRLLSYEGPFGFGYAVASFQVIDPYKSLAVKTLKHYLDNHDMMTVPDDLPEEMLIEKAGVFVSIKKNGHLRGCIGTIQPSQKKIAKEIIQNTLSASFKDPRFPPIQANEFNDLSFSVDVLKAAEPVDHIGQLDVKRYGIIVRHGYRSGLLLPNLEGIDTVEEQIDIALRKAGIASHEDYEIQRFEVVRH
jgi:AmmeMemoRadiSam system protein A/AmmeMemoRadiSam system protein B